MKALNLRQSHRGTENTEMVNGMPAMWERIASATWELRSGAAIAVANRSYMPMNPALAARIKRSEIPATHQH